MDYREFPERSHFTIGEKGWEEVADYTLAWAVEQAAEYEAVHPARSAKVAKERHPTGDAGDVGISGHVN